MNCLSNLIHNVFADNQLTELFQYTPSCVALGYKYKCRMNTYLLLNSYINLSINYVTWTCIPVTAATLIGLVQAFTLGTGAGLAALGVADWTGCDVEVIVGILRSGNTGLMVLITPE
jgi:hypothetical protein